MILEKIIRVKSSKQWLSFSSCAISSRSSSTTNEYQHIYFTEKKSHLEMRVCVCVCVCVHVRGQTRATREEMVNLPPL